MTKATIILDTDKLYEGFVTVTLEDDKGMRTGALALNKFADMMNELFGWETGTREVKLISRFSSSPFLASGHNGPRWVAVKEVAPAEYFLTTATGKAFKVQFPRLVVKASNYGASYLFWTKDEVLKPESKLYPLIVGNIDINGWVCIGSTGIKSKSMDDIDHFVRLVIEAPTTGTYIPQGTKIEEWFQSLTERWDDKIGKKYPITLDDLIRRQDR